MKFPEIIFEDDQLIALNKPSFLLSIPDRYDSNKPNLKSLLLTRFKAIYPVHRLDYETSGIILFAKDELTHRQLSGQIMKREINKTYHAIAVTPAASSGLIEESIAESKSKKGHYKVHTTGKESKTAYKILESFGNYSLLELDLITGRTHQIRVHLKHIGAPLLVDKKYGLADAFYLSSIKRIKLKSGEKERPLLARSSLHARSLRIFHPAIHKELLLEARWAKDFNAVVNQLRKSKR